MTPQKEKKEFKYKSVRFKSKTPLKMDLLFAGLISMLLGVLFLYVIYLALVDWVRSLAYYTLFLEIAFVMGIMLISDILSYYLSEFITDILIHEWGYIRNIKKRKNKAFRYVDYAFYTLFRSICLVFALVWVLSSYLYYNLPYPYYIYSFLWAWLTISFVCKVLSWGLTNYIFPS